MSSSPPTAPTSSPPQPPPAPTRSALLLIDVQDDFCPGGRLPVADGDAVVPVCNALRALIAFDLVVLSQDWHPPGHASFASTNGAEAFTQRVIPTPARTLAPRQVDSVTQVMWPDHCVQGSPGAALCAALARAPGDALVQKGTARGVDSYSAFGDEFHGQFEDTRLAALLRGRGVTHVAVAGLALDYCVAYTCLDAARLGFAAYLVLDGCRPVDATRATDAYRGVLAELQARGVVLVQGAADLPAAHFPRRAEAPG